jgi:outer membrane protein OmpU
MNKLSKVGLTALTTTLVATSAYSADLSVTGSASIAYTGLDNTSQTSPYSMGDSVNFVGSGDLDNGMNVTFSYELDNGATDDMSIKIGLADDMGTITFSGNSVRAGGAGTVQDIIPNAYTPVYENANETTGAVDNGLVVSTSGENQAGMWGYSNTIGDLTVSLGFNPVNGTTTANLNPGSETSVGLSYNTPIEGLRVVAGVYADDNIADSSTYGVSYTYGPVVAAYQRTEVDYDTAQGSADQDAEHMGISFAVNENLTIAGGIQEVDITGSTLNEENSGIGVSYTMGSITLSAQRNKLENGSGVAARDVTANMVGLSFAF